MIIQIKMDIKRHHAIMEYFKSYIVVAISVNNFVKKSVLDLLPLSTPSVFDYVSRVSRACTCAK